MKKQLSLIILGLLLVSMIAFLPNIANIAQAYTPADYKASIIAAADRLVALQSVAPGPPTPPDYGWDYPNTGLTSHTAQYSAYNMFGVTALGLIDAYELTGTAAYLTAARNTAGFIAYGDPSAGDFLKGHDYLPGDKAYHWGYSYDYRLLMSCSAASGDPSYKNYALAAWAWEKANRSTYYGDGNQSALWDYYIYYTGDPGYAAWGTSDWGLATLKMGDTLWAQGMATVIHDHMAEILASDPMAMGAALKFLVTNGGYAGDVTLLKNQVVTLQKPDGSWEFPGYPYPDTQSTAYAIMGLWAAGEYTAAQRGADWLMSTQGTLGALPGGWPQSNGDGSYDEYPEFDSEALQATFAVTSYASRLYIDPPTMNKAPGDVNSFFDVYVKLENFGNLAGFDIKLTWGNTLITWNSTEYTTYLDALWGAGKWSIIKEEFGAGYYRLAAVALGTSASNIGASVLFKVTFKVVKSCNFVLTTDILFDVHKLSDNGTPIPNPIIPATIAGCRYTISGTTPDLEIVVVGQYHAPPFEYCDTFELEVYVTDICVNSPLTDYHLTIQYGSHLAKFMGVAAWGIFGTNSFTNTTGEILVEGAGSGWWGHEGLLVKLTFHVEFSNTEEHVWKYGNDNYEEFNIAITDAALSFATGTIPKTGIDIIPASVTIRVNFIRGDVNCDGKVNIEDISDATYSYDKKLGDPDWPAVRRYDLNNDGVIDVYDFVAIATNYGYGIPHH